MQVCPIRCAATTRPDRQLCRAAAAPEATAIPPPSRYPRCREHGDEVRERIVRFDQPRIRIPLLLLLFAVTAHISSVDAIPMPIGSYGVATGRRSGRTGCIPQRVVRRRQTQRTARSLAGAERRSRRSAVAQTCDQCVAKSCPARSQRTGWANHPPTSRLGSTADRSS